MKNKKNNKIIITSICLLSVFYFLLNFQGRARAQIALLETSIDSRITAFLIDTNAILVPFPSFDNVIDFEDQADDTTLYNQYAHLGVIFPYSPRVIIPSVDTISGSKVLTTWNLGEEFDPTPLTIQFTVPQATVGVHIGVNHDTHGYQIPAYMRAYDQNNNLIDEKGPLYLPAGPTPVQRLLYVSSEMENIWSVEVEFQTAYWEFIDDLGFSTIGLPPPADTQPPLVHITEPVNGAVFDSYEGQNCFPLDGFITENEKIKKVTLFVSSGGQSRTMQLSVGGGSGPDFSYGYGALFYGLLFEGENTLTVRAEDYAGLTDQETIQVTYAPIQEESRLLIITPWEFRQALVPLVDYKNNTGMPTHIISLEAIDHDPRFSSGDDLAEKVKFAIVYGEKNYGTEYVMLVGDSDRFPVRYCRINDPTKVGWGTAFAPSDLYYADLYKQNGSFDTWDSNGNGYYGEIDSVWDENDTYADINVDNVDLKPDVAVGRVPASSIAEVSTYVNKVIAYENGASGTWFHKTLLLTGGYGGYPGDESTCNWIADNCLSGFTKTKYYYNDHQGSVNSRADQINTYLNEGMGFVSYIGHGGIYELGQIYNVLSHMNNLTNDEKLPIIFAAACDTAMFHFMHGEYLAIDGRHPPVNPGCWEHPVPEPDIIQPLLYDQDSCAENFLVKHPTGGIGYIGCDTGSQGGGLILAKYFAESYDYLSSGQVTLGAMWNRALNVYVQHNCHYDVDLSTWWYPATMFHHIQKYLLFGDPSLRVGGSPMKYLTHYPQFEQRVSNVIVPVLLSDREITIAGQTDIRGNILVYEDERFVGKASPGRSGDFSTIVENELAEGVHLLTLQGVDQAGRLIEEQTVRVRVDTTSPEINNLTYPKQSTAKTLYFRGTTERGAVIALYEDDRLLAETKALTIPEGRGEGFFELKSGIDLSPGEHAFILKATDMAGNEAIYPEPLFVEILQEMPAIQEMPERCECSTGEVSRAERGDLNGDGRITREDALIAFKCYMGNGECVPCTDVTCDGKITPSDALCIFNRYMGLASCLDE